MDDDTGWLEQKIAEDGERILSLLRRVLATCGVTRKDVDQILHKGAGFTSAVLTRRIELKQEHVSAILLALDVHPSLFYEVLYPRERPIGPVQATEDAARRVALASIAPPSPPPPPLPAPPSLAPAEIQALIDESVRRALAAAGSKPKRKRRAGKPKKKPARPPDD